MQFANNGGYYQISPATTPLPSAKTVVDNGTTYVVCQIPVDDRILTVRQAITASSRIMKTCESPCKAKIIRLQFRIRPAECSSCTPTFSFWLKRNIPPDRTQDVFAFNLSDQHTEYDASNYIGTSANGAAASPSAVTPAQIITDILNYFNTVLPSIGGHSEYSISSVTSDSTTGTIDITCAAGFCFDFDVFEHDGNNGVIVAKTVLEPFNDEGLTNAMLRKQNDPVLLMPAPGFMVPKIHGITNKFCFYHLQGVQNILDSSAGYSRFENSENPGTITSSVPFDIFLLVEQDGQAAAWETALLAATGYTGASKQLEVVTPCNFLTNPNGNSFNNATQQRLTVTQSTHTITATLNTSGNIVTTTPNLTTITWNGKTGVIASNSAIVAYGSNATLLKPDGSSLTDINQPGGTKALVKIGSVTTGTYQYQVNGVATAIPAGTGYTVEFDMTFTLTIDGVARLCTQRVRRVFNAV